MFWRVVFMAAMATAVAFAQGGGDMGNGGMGGRGGGGMNAGGMEGGGMGGGMRMQQQRQSPFDLFAEKLKLNKDQKTESLTILQDAAKEIAPIQQQLQQARQNLAGALISGQTGDQVDQLLKAYAPLASQTAAIEAKAFAKICKMLKPNQEKNAAQAFELLAETLDRPRMGGARGGNRSER
ncbi:MAG TPA: hypothetical protein VLW65_09140 [Bryobacteraceae bacterium]|nr:hypothetical protein [Bryobacteraceae bacterium]